MPSYTTWDDHAKVGGQLAVLYSCWGARPKSGAMPPAKSTTTSGAKPKHHTMLDPVNQPKDWFRTYAMRMREPPNWWLEFPSLYLGCTGELPMTFVQQQANKQAVGFQLPATQAKNQDGGILPQPQNPMPQQFHATWRPWGLLVHLWDEEREKPGLSQSPANLFQKVWWALWHDVPCCQGSSGMPS